MGRNGVRCPNCGNATGEEVNGELLGPEIKRTFECADCGNEWDVVV